MTEDNVLSAASGQRLQARQKAGEDAKIQACAISAIGALVFGVLLRQTPNRDRLDRRAPRGRGGGV